MTEGPDDIEADETPLCEVTLEQMADELDRRFRHALIVVDGPHKVRERTSRIGYYSRGSAVGALGLASWAVARLSEPDGDEQDGADF